MGRNLRKLRAATYNLGNASFKRVKEDLNDLAFVKVQIMGLVEHADRDELTDEWLEENPGWDKWAGDGDPGELKVCILWQKSLGKLKAKASKQLVAARRLPQGAGPENAPPKVAHRIKLKVGRKSVHFIVAHQYATVHNRREAARLFMTALKDWVRTRRGLVITVGDMNETPKQALVRSLRALFTDVSKTGATHGRRVIDYIFVRGGTITKSFDLPLSSDHDAVIADIEY